MKVEQVIEEGAWDYLKGAAGKVAKGVKSIHQAGKDASAQAEAQKAFTQWMQQTQAILMAVPKMRQLYQQYPDMIRPMLSDAQGDAGQIIRNIFRAQAAAAPAAAPAAQAAPAQSAPPAPAGAQGAPAPAAGGKAPASRQGKGALLAAQRRRAAEEKRRQELEQREMIRNASESVEAPVKRSKKRAK